jgi:hypothetical protein
MEDNTLSFYVHEAEMARMERINKRLFIALVIASIALACSNIKKLFG